jgi:hypothetical protein
MKKVTVKRLKKIVRCDTGHESSELQSMAKEILDCRAFIRAIREENQSEIALRCRPGDMRAMQ